MKRILICISVLVSVVCVAQVGLRNPAFITSLKGAGVDCNSVDDSSLKAWWKMEGASGNDTDSKGTNTLIDHNGVTSQSPGKIERTSQYFSAPDGPDISGRGQADIMFGGWFLYSAVLAGSPSMIAKYHASGNQREYFLVESSALQRYECFYSSNGTSTAAVAVVANSAGDPADSTWHFVVTWYDNSAKTINIQVDNGAVDSVSYGTGVFNGTGDLNIGAVDGAQNWQGYIDEVFITNRILTAAELTALYNSGLACRPSTIP